MNIPNQPITPDNARNYAQLNCPELMPVIEQLHARSELLIQAVTEYKKEQDDEADGTFTWDGWYKKAAAQLHVAPKGKEPAV